MKVPNPTATTKTAHISLSRLQNEGSQPSADGSERGGKSIKATE